MLALLASRFIPGLCLVVLLAPFPMAAQTILVKPYLQLATPASMVIMWETNVNTETIVQYGLTQSLGNSATGTTITTLGSTILHTVQLTALKPGTRYYYKAITGTWESAIYDFVTPPLRSSEGGLNIVLMSDMQKDGGNPNIFSNLINTSLLPYIDSQYGSPLSDHLQMAVLPGDVVDNGNTYLQWKNDFFNPGETLWRSVPCYPAIGNHEANSQNYFNYYTLPENGTPGYLEHWYYHDYSNVRVLSIDSNSPYLIQAQLDWVDSILNVSCMDTFIDFVFAEMHHPFKSELWTPGETNYTGEIVERLENFSTTCGKPSIHFFGHTHAYSRGESRDHQHLWVNVATSGGNIDYWGEFQNADYDEFIVSQDEYGFVMVEITAGPDPQFVMKRLSFGDQYDPGGCTETDVLTIRINNTPPTIPIPLFPRVSDTVSSFCFTMKADGFSDPDEDEHGASHWQISTDSANFSAPVFDSWKQYANWYDEVNLQANDDLTDEEAADLPSGVTLWWRVRYRDKSLEWSPWSAHTRFYTGSLDTLAANLVTNGGAESGITGWTPTIGVIESLDPQQCDGIDPYSGQKYFAVGALCVEHPFASAYQDHAVTNFASAIDSGNVLANYGAYMADWANTDEPSMSLQFLADNNAVLGNSDTLRHRLSAWTLKQNSVAVPAGTRTIRCIVMGTRFSGIDNDSYLDNIYCRLLSGDMTCSEYVSPGPAAGRIYVDQEAIGFPDGESWTTAYRTVGQALLQSNADTSIHEIWVAEGYYPVTSNTERDSSYYIQRAIGVYGGFSGNESLLSQRNISSNPVHLTGEIGDTSLLTDNSYHVLHISNTQDTVIFDGFTVSRGYADGAEDTSGGGIHITGTNTELVIIRNCQVQENYALQGSSLYNQAESHIENSTIHNSVIPGITTSSVMNTGMQASLTLNDCMVIQECVICPEIIRNISGAILQVNNTVTIEKE